MSRPPYRHRDPRTMSRTTAAASRQGYLPMGYPELLAVEEEGAAARIGRASSAAPDGPGGGDVTRTFMEMSALVAHVLSVYQRRYAAEAFLGTARSRVSLLRHARRLAYEPNPGVAATGHVVLFAKPEAKGVVAAGLPLASVPVGDAKAQDYETRDDLLVDAALNELAPANAVRQAQVKADAKELRIAGRGHRLQPRDTVALIVPKKSPDGAWSGAVLTVSSAAEDASADVTTVRFTTTIGIAVVVEPDSHPFILARPGLSMRQFASDADPALYPLGRVRAATDVKAAATPTTPAHWYEVSGGNGYQASDVYLSQQAPVPLAGDFVVRRTSASAEVLQVVHESLAAVVLHRESTETYSVPTPVETQEARLERELAKARAQGQKEKADIGAKADMEQVLKADQAQAAPAGQAGGAPKGTAGTGGAVTVVPQAWRQTVRSHLSATVTAIRVTRSGSTPVSRATLDLPSEWLTAWEVRAELAAEEPNTDLAAGQVDLPGHLESLVPGRLLLLADASAETTQVVAVQRAAKHADGLGRRRTRVEWKSITDGPPDGWSLGGMRVFGNVARVSHGRTVEETLGGSDGVTPFQEFTLAESPVTVLPGTSGGEFVLEVRVDDVLWQPVRDFSHSGQRDRHYRAVTDENGVTTVVFGDGRSGAVPPTGRRNVRAVYRVGLGRRGDSEVSRLSRVKRTHPLLDRVVNLTPVRGGAEPATYDDIRVQSTRWIRTFDRAVSAGDLADLALTMPGIARAASRWDQARGAVVVVATADGREPASLGAVRDFLDRRRDTSVPMSLTGPSASPVYLTVTVETDPAFSDDVKRAVAKALHGTDANAPGMFTFAARDLGQAAFLSEVYACVQKVPGVFDVRVDRFSDEDDEAVEQELAVDVDGWLELSPQRLLVQLAGRVTPP